MAGSTRKNLILLYYIIYSLQIFHNRYCRNNHVAQNARVSFLISQLEAGRGLVRYLQKPLLQNRTLRYVKILIPDNCIMLVAVLSTRHIHRISIASSVIPIVTIEGQYRASKIIVTWRIKDENRCNGSFKSRLSSLNILQMLKHFWHSSAHKSIPRTPTADADAFLPNYLSARKRKLGVGRSWYKKNRARFNERRLSTSGSFQAISKHLKFFSKHSKTKVQIEQRRLTNSSFAATISRRLPF